WWLALAGAGAPLAATFLWLGAGWQQDLRELVGSAGPAWHPVPVALASAGVFAVLLAGSRAVRLGTRRLAGTFGRFSPRPVASVAAVGVVAALSFGLGQGVVFNGFVDVADRFAAAANDSTRVGVTRPASPYVSGAPGSLVPWDSLGAYGREFTAGAVPHHELATFATGAAEPPVRVYVGRDSAPDLAGQAELAVRELERTGGFDRSVLAVVATTGTGWVNPAVPESIEYLTAGDSATVAMQYSYLPSWISFLADRSTAAEAATTLVDAIQAELATRPAGQRPALVVYGESLGAWGLEAAYGDLDGLLAGTDRALLAGPPHSNPIWQAVTGDRAPDGPVWQPYPGMVYLQNRNDPVVVWSPELLWRPPDAPDTPGRWLPVVTFWQVTVDLITSTKAPSGHGHSYQDGIADGWAQLLAPPGWTDADTARLRAELG
ncbi:MAG: alpha/beta-hydrolase family protein, partial [Natronosporangium sp.]